MIDKFDYNLIRELQNDGRTSYVDLAKKLGVVEGTIRKRLKKLLDNNILEIRAMPKPRGLGFNVASLMGIGVRLQDLRKVAVELAKKPNVVYLAFVTGRYEIMTGILTRSVEELGIFIEKEVATIPGIERTETFLNLETIKGAQPGIDVSQLLDLLNFAEKGGVK